MSERTTKVFNRTKQVDDAVTLYANGQVYYGWKDVTIDRELNSVASVIELSITEKWSIQNEPWRLKPGDEIHVHIGRTSIFRGYVDALDVSFNAESRTTKVSARSRTADLIDCSVVGANEFNNLTINQIATQLLKPFGLSVVLKTAPGDKFTKFTVQQGETVHEVLDRLAREREMLLYPSYEGNLVMEKRGQVLGATELVQGENVFSATLNNDISNRFSQYIVKSQTPGLTGGTADQAAGVKGTSTDDGISRYRPIVIVSENPTDAAGAQRRAVYEANLRLAKSAKVSVEVQGWFQRDKKPWAINEMVFTNLPYLGVRSKLLITKTKFTKGQDGTKTNLELINPNAFTFEEKTVKKESDFSQFLGELRKQVKR